MRIVIVLASLFLFSCKKCETCTSWIKSTSSTPQAGYPKTEMSTYEACDEDLKEAKSHNKTYTFGNITIEEKTVCN